MTAVSDEEITYYCRDRMMLAKRSRQVSEVSKAMLALQSGRLVEADVDVNISCYHYYGLRPYFGTLCDLLTERCLLGMAST